LRKLNDSLLQLHSAYEHADDIWRVISAHDITAVLMWG